jgi:hypothetical protein
MDCSWLIMMMMKVNKITPKKYESKEFIFRCLPILNYDIIIVIVSCGVQDKIQ